MNTIPSRDLAKLSGFALLAAVLPGCTINDYSENPPPAPAQVEYVPVPPPPPPQPDYVPPTETVIVIRTESDFYEPLGRYGHWVDFGGYGRCWTPDGVDRDWRPYTLGHWERTDDGWYWASDEPWGWATCHYGRWFFDPRFGWLWMPQTEWAPAWVAWRDGDDYTGWAPLPPRARFRADGALERPDEDVDPHLFVFVEKRRMLERQRPQTVIVNNVTIIQKTVNVTKVTVVNKTVINEGPSLDAVQRASGRQIHVEPAHKLRTEHEAPVAAKEHLRTETVQAGKAQRMDENRSNMPRKENRDQKTDQRPQDQRPRVPENLYVPPQQQGQLQQPGIVAPPPNQPRPPQEQPMPRPVIPEQVRKNEQNSRTNLVKQQRESEQKPKKPLPPVHPNVPPGELKRPVQPEPKPEYNAQNPNVPKQPKLEQDNKPAPPGPQSVPPQQKPEQKKPHLPQEKGRHSSTNAPPQQR